METFGRAFLALLGTDIIKFTKSPPSISPRPAVQHADGRKVGALPILLIRAGSQTGGSVEAGQIDHIADQTNIALVASVSNGDSHAICWQCWN
jgi:hypothetical protein